MTLLNRIAWWEKIKCSVDNQNEISQALKDVSEAFQTTVYILMDDSGTWIATEKSAFSYGDNVLELVQNEEWEWNPPGFTNTSLEAQLAKLNRDSPDSQ